MAVQTPKNIDEFGSQSKLIRKSFTQSPVTAQIGSSKLIKGGELMLHQDALQAARITELEEKLAAMIKRKTREQKRIQQGGTVKYGRAAAQVAAEASGTAKQSKKACGGCVQERAQPAV
jgi:hypothetical protein